MELVNAVIIGPTHKYLVEEPEGVISNMYSWVLFYPRVCRLHQLFV